MTRAAIVGLSLAVAQLMLLGSRSIAQEAFTVSIHSVDDSAFPTVTAALTVDERGRPVTDIVLGDGQIEESGAQVEQVSVRRATDANIPLALVVTIDVSGSMEGETLTKAQSSAIGLINSLASWDRAAVVSFSDSVRVEQDLTGDRSTSRDAISRLRADGSTALYDGVARSTELAGASGFSRRAIVLLSDGKESGDASALSREGSLAAAANGSSPFYVVGVGPEIDREYLEQLAVRSGGRYFEAAGAAQVPDVYSSLEELLRSQFIVTFRATSSADQQDRLIRITIRRGAMSAAAEHAYKSLRSRPAGAEAEQTAVEVGSVLPSTADFPGYLVVLPPIVVAAAGALAWRRRHPKRSSADEPDAEEERYETPRGEAEPVAVASSTIVVVSGPVGESTGAIEVRGEPVTVGWSDSCSLRLAQDSGVAAEHARLWVRDGKLMLHHVASGSDTRIRGRTAIWASLNDGDQFEIGPYVLEWRNGWGENGQGVSTLPDHEATPG